MQFIKNIQNFAFQNDLWKKNSKIIIGISGGPDSVCLLDVLVNLAPKYNFKLHLAHVNYRLRDKDADLDEQLVKDLAKRYGLEVSTLKPRKSDYKGNLESSLRDIRYGFFEKLRQELDFDRIAVAHNQDDQAETVLMRVLRGSGLEGLSAIKAKSGHIIRPLLHISKAEILSYNKLNKLKFRTDKSNQSFDFTRNKIRHDLIPYLEKTFNPSLKKTLTTWSENVAEDYDYINKQAERFSDKACKNKCSDFSAQDFLLLHPSIQRQVLRNIFSSLKGDKKDMESKQVDEILKVIKSSKNKASRSLVGGLKISRNGAKIKIFC